MTELRPQDSVGLPHLDDLRWRVDVTLSTGSMSRVLKPTILMQATLSDGSIRTFEVNVEQFHELRHSVARCLHEMEVVQPKMDQAVDAGKKIKTQWEKVHGLDGTRTTAR